ncbi:MAG: hypothetical protein SF028_12665, partial [Candidatus Sumerlaeia bacterium]|nr:hypothetical protein [Candidatus Sumerlaeia bacterium]
PPAAGAAPAGAAAPAAAAAAPPQQSSSPDASAQKTALAQRAFVRGMQFFKEGEFDKARPFFEAAIQNDPVNEPHYHHKYAICLSRAKGGFTKAVDAALKACEMDVYNLEFKLTLGEIYENAGVPTKAQQVYEDVLKWDPDNTKAKNKLKFVIEANRKVGFLEKHMPSLFGKKG